MLDPVITMILSSLPEFFDLELRSFCDMLLFVNVCLYFLSYLPVYRHRTYTHFDYLKLKMNRSGNVNRFLLMRLRDTFVHKHKCAKSTESIQLSILGNSNST